MIIPNGTEVNSFNNVRCKNYFSWIGLSWINGHLLYLNIFLSLVCSSWLDGALHYGALCLWLLCSVGECSTRADGTGRHQSLSSATTSPAVIGSAHTNNPSTQEQTGRTLYLLKTPEVCSTERSITQSARLMLKSQRMLLLVTRVERFSFVCYRKEIAQAITEFKIIATQLNECTRLQCFTHRLHFAIAQLVLCVCVYKFESVSLLECAGSSLCSFERGKRSHFELPWPRPTHSGLHTLLLHVYKASL